jgi:pyruvate dehydrogenase E1 component beta subunit
MLDCDWSSDVCSSDLPGLRVVTPSSPARAYGLLLAAMRDPDPVVFLEPTRLYRLFREDVVDDGEALPLDACFPCREGSDVTLVAWGAMIRECLRAADLLSQEGVEAEVIDVATLKPFDVETVLASVEKTGRCVVVQEAPRCAGFAAEIAAEIAERALYSLQAPVRRVAGYDVVTPLSRLEGQFIPGPARIIDAVRKMLEGA